MVSDTTLFRTRVPAQRLRAAEEILSRLGLKPGDAFNMLLAQIELKQGLPFEVSIAGTPLMTAEQQAEAWSEVLGEY
jgi:addiction module RelB/DinJ family antitoxin